MPAHARPSPSVAPTRPWDALCRALWRSPIGIATLGPDLRYDGVNDALAEMNGVAASEHLGRTAEQVLPFAPHVARAQQTVLATGVAVQGVAVVRPAGDGREEARTVRAFVPLTGPSGEPAGVATVAFPWPIEELLAERLVESAPEGIALVDPSLRYLLANASIARINGTPAEDHLGRRLRDVVPRVAGWVEPMVDAVLESGKAITGIAVRAPRPHGLTRHYVCSFFPVRTPARVLGVGSIVTDVTRLREREAWLARSRSAAETAAEQARRDAQELDDVVRAISHDLKTPLAALLGYAQLVDKHADRPEVVRRAAGSLQRTGKRLEAMLTDLAEMVRLEAGTVPARAEPVDLASFLADLRERLGGALDLGRVGVKLPPDLPIVLADPARLERILVNLLTNALKYSPPGAPVELAATREPDAVAIAITDRGTGIDPDELPRVFERFYRARGAERSTGLGLGLYLARLLAESQGGTLSATSAVGEGSTFTVRLRIAQ